MINASPLVLIVIVLFLALGLSYNRANSGKRFITDYLMQKGATNITVNWDWAGGDRSNQAFDVEYVGYNSERYQTRRKISSFWFNDLEIYWRDPPQF